MIITLTSSEDQEHTSEGGPYCTLHGHLPSPDLTHSSRKACGALRSPQAILQLLQLKN